MNNNNEIPEVDLSKPLSPERKKDILDKLEQDYQISISSESERRIISMADLLKEASKYMREYQHSQT